MQNFPKTLVTILERSNMGLLNWWSSMSKKKSKKQITIKPVQVKFQKKSTQKMDWGIKLLRVHELWKETKGRGAKIAILDTGIIPHPDLKPNIKGGINFTTSNRDDYTDRQGHGTHVAGIIAAADNTIGVVGVAPEAGLYAVKVLGDDGSGAFEWIIDGIKWAVDHQMDVISMSLGSSFPPPTDALHDAIKDAYAHNVTIVAAAGNDGDEYPDDDIDWPGRYPETIAVGSIKKDKTRSYFSSDGEELDVMAPGEEIQSTFLNDSYQILSGTSMATPFVSGVLALIISKHRHTPDNKTPVDTPQRLREHLIRTADDAGEIGRDNFYGYGIISPKKFLQGLNIQSLYNPV